MAGTVTRTDPPGDLRAKGLTTAEKLALDTFRVSATRVSDLLRVELRFRGNLEARLGRGHLRGAAAGIVLVSQTGGTVAIATVGRTARARTLVGVPRRPRGAATALPKAAVSRDGRILRFYLSGYDLEQLKEIRAGTVPTSSRPRKARPSDELWALYLLKLGPFGDKLKGVPRPPASVNDCRTLRQLMEEVSDAIDEALKEKNADINVDPLRHWQNLARERLAQLCPPASGPGVGNPQPGNTAPTASFTFSPANNPPTAPRAGSAVSFTGTASDSDGSVVSWKWEFGDGESQTGTGAAPAASHAYGQAGRYNARLIVTDNRGTTYTTASQEVQVSGPGSKASRVFTHPADPLFCDPGTHTFDIWVPSWAQPPYSITWNDELCPTAIKSVSIAEFSGGAPPPGEDLLDPHGRPKKGVRVTVTITSGSGTDSSAQLTLNWN